MTTTAIFALTLDGTLRFPAHSLLSLASQIVRLLHGHCIQQLEKCLYDEDEYESTLENWNDVEITLQELDPVYWKEFDDRQRQLLGGSPLWTATELAHRAEPEARMNVLLELSRIPKASCVMLQAVNLWRESRGAGVNSTENLNRESEDAQLDFLIFLSEKRGRAELFKLVTPDASGDS